MKLKIIFYMLNKISFFCSSSHRVSQTGVRDDCQGVSNDMTKFVKHVSLESKPNLEI